MCRMKIQSSIAVKLCISKQGGAEGKKTADREARSLELVTTWPKASWCHPLEPIFSVGQRKGLNEVISQSLGGRCGTSGRAGSSQSPGNRLFIHPSSQGGWGGGRAHPSKKLFKFHRKFCEFLFLLWLWGEHGASSGHGEGSSEEQRPV